MQVGDLVELSAYGRKLKAFKCLRGYHGILIDYYSNLAVWKVHWFGKPNCVIGRKNIKQLKVKKST